MNNSTIGLGWGFGAAGVSIVFFGSNFVPAKKIETGDGLFFQFVVCNAILFVGVIVNAIRNFPRFYPLVMVGGALWATGNVCVIPIIKTIGLGLGILIWAIFNMVCGWASGRFGLFGIQQEIPPNQAFNYVGVALCAVSGLLYMFVKTEVSTSYEESEQNYRRIDDDNNDQIISPNQLNTLDQHKVVINSTETVEEGMDAFLDKLSTGTKRAIGCFLAAASGVMYGFQFVPYLYVTKHYEGASQNAVDYVFAQFVGTYVTSLLFLLIYAAVKRNKPSLYPSALLPGMACGFMWSIADVCWFIANEALGETISFPLITTTPPVITNLWTILLFREIKGCRNFAILASAFAVTCVGVVFIVVSKV